jgi:hypothetical protein
LLRKKFAVRPICVLQGIAGSAHKLLIRLLAKPLMTSKVLDLKGLNGTAQKRGNGLAGAVGQVFSPSCPSPPGLLHKNCGQYCAQDRGVDVSALIHKGKIGQLNF